VVDADDVEATPVDRFPDQSRIGKRTVVDAPDSLDRTAEECVERRVMRPGLYAFPNDGLCTRATRLLPGTMPA